MVVISLGSFDLVSPPNDPGRYVDERRPSGVRIDRSFAMATHKVTVAQYRKFAEATGRKAQPCHANLPGSLWSRLNSSTTWRNPSFHQRPDHPVVCVSHGDATAYADWISGRTTAERPATAECAFSADEGSSMRESDRGNSLRVNPTSIHEVRHPTEFMITMTKNSHLFEIHRNTKTNRELQTIPRPKPAFL